MEINRNGIKHIALYIIILLFSCKDEKLIGSWISCENDGYYRELHFSEDRLISLSGYNLIYIDSVEYEINGDTIFYQNQVQNKKYKDHYELSKKKLTLTNINEEGNTRISFKKNSNSSLLSNLNYSEIENEFFQRKKEIQCITEN